MTEAADKRTAFRVTEAIRVAFEPVSQADWYERLDLMAVAAASVQNAKSAVQEVSTDIHRKLIAAHRVSDTIATCLELLNKKIDILVDQVSVLQEAQGEFADVPVRRCEISANGIKFVSGQTLETGTKLHLRLLLVTDSFYFEALGEIVRVQSDPEQTGKHEIAIQYKGIRESDRDRLIKHLLNRQSETIRAKRLRLEAVAELEDVDPDDI